MELKSSPTATHRGILAINISTFAFVVGDTLLKLLGASIPMTEIIFLRSGVIAAAIITLFVVRRQRLELTRKMSGPLLLRCVLDCVNIASITTAVIHMPLAEMYAIFLTAPILITVIAAVTLNEPVGYRRWFAVFVGFVGVLLIIKPDPDKFDSWALVAFLSAVATACREVVTRKIAKNIPALEITFYSALFVGAVSIFVGFAQSWSIPSHHQALLLVLQAIAWFVGTSLVIYASRAAPMSVVAPFRYTTLFWGGAAGYLVFANIPDVLALFGTLLIGVAGLYTFHRETVLRRAV